ncbi:Prenyl cysteine carboxyl methyltransferase Ste14, partial [Penicillium argentinense]
MPNARTTSADSSDTMSSQWAPDAQVEPESSPYPSEWHPYFARRQSTSSLSSSDPPTTTPTPNTIYPDGAHSLAGISLRAFLLGTSLGVTATLTLLTTTLTPTAFWRIPFFIAALSLFHFLEFFVTARYNTPEAKVKAFLLSSNGWAYNTAHGSALMECALSHWLWPDGSRVSQWLSFTDPIFGTKISILLSLGLLLTGVGQLVRTLAMAQAASNFNHHVQSTRRDGHVLVKSGVYAYLRHPSYFGFFWWGLGTQLVLGNVVCFFGYTFVLWRFFSTRIKSEEQFLISFFGADYVQYREEKPVGIPGI